MTAKESYELDTLYDLHTLLHEVFNKKIERAIALGNNGTLDEILKAEVEWKTVMKYEDMISHRIAELLTKA